MVHGQDLTWYMVVNMGHEHGASHEWAVHPMQHERGQ